jgi:hypothetical protein
MTDARKPYSLSLDEQYRLFQVLPTHSAQMCLFKINTGCLEQEVSQLRWDSEVRIPKNGADLTIPTFSHIRSAR